MLSAPLLLLLTSMAAEAPSAAVYSGHLVHGQAHGRGKMSNSDGSSYEGEWKEGKRHGLGVQITAEGKRYEGQWREDKPDGLGAEWDKEGVVECGRWEMNTLVESCAVACRCLPEGKLLSAAALKAKHDHPNGSALMPGGTHYIGQLNARGQPHGQGACFHPDGSPEVTLLIDAADASKNGRWVDGKVHGRVSILFAEGDRYEGMFKDSDFNGLGVLSWDGSRYEGEFVDDQFSGLGARWDKDGKLVECGRWKEGLCVKSRAVPLRCLPEGNHLSVAALQAKQDHPNSSALMADGSFYIGELNAEGQPDGQGASFYPDGSARLSLLVDPADASNSGRWIEGKLQGRALWIGSTGDRYEGMFKDSNFDGLGVLSWKSGLRYEGELAANKRNGFGALWDATGKLLECGRWEDGKFMQSCAVPLRCIPEGKHLSAAALKAKRDHPNESVLFRDNTHYVGSLNAAGQPHGQGACFHPDGSPQVTLLTDAADESKNGRWVDGMVQGRAIALFANGNRYEGMFKDFKFNGLGVFWKADGSCYEGEWAASKCSGLGAKWNKDCKLNACGRWEDGKLVESRAVPLRCLSEGIRLSRAALQAKRDHPNDSALMSDGTHYIGSLNAEGQPHGQGASFHPDGSPASAVAASGLFGRPSIAAAAASSVAFRPTPVAAAAAASSLQLHRPTQTHAHAPHAPAAAATPPAAAAHAPVAAAAAAAASRLPLKCFNRKALLFGNNRYDAPVNSLGCCGNDALDMQSALTKLGFHCTLLLDAPKKKMTHEHHKFVASLKRGDIVFFYFSGHGEEANGITYLLPSDFVAQGDGCLRDDAVSLNNIMSDLNHKDSDLINIIVCDCCRANKDDVTWKGGSGEMARSAAQLDAQRAGGEEFVRKPTSGQFFIAYSSDPGTVSFERGDERNGYFTGALLAQLLTPGLHIEQIFKRANAQLEIKSNKKQRAWHSSSLKEDIILLPNA